MRIVLDTNVVLSALLWRGTPYRILEAVRRSDTIRLFSSAVLLEELAEILNRPMAAQRLAAIDLAAAQVLTDYLDIVGLVTPEVVPRVVADDPDDDHVLAAAVAAQADLIVSGDRHLLRIGTHAGILIVNPADAIARLGVNG